MTGVVKKSVLLIDDHPVIAVGIGLALGDSPLFVLAGVVTTPSACMANVESLRPDALILDLVFDGALLLSLVPQCRTALPNAAIVVFSSLPEQIYARRAMDAGADAYINKSTDLAALLQFIEGIAPRPSGQSRIAPSAKDDIASGDLTIEGVYLTPRETAIARNLGRGLSIAAIAREIGISANTVAVHRDNIRRKLDCRDTNELVARLARMDVLSDSRR